MSLALQVFGHTEVPHKCQLKRMKRNYHNPEGIVNVIHKPQGNDCSNHKT